MDFVLEMLAYAAIGLFLVLRIAMLAAFILLPIAVVRTIRRSRSAVPHRAPAAK